VVLVQRVLAEAQSKPREFIKLHTAHFEGMCRSVLSDGGAVAAMRRLQADLLLLDVAFTCASAITGKPRLHARLRPSQRALPAAARRLPAAASAWLVSAAVSNTPGPSVPCMRLHIHMHAETMGMPPFVLFGPVDIVDPLWSEMAALPYSPAVHTFLGSGLAHPLVSHPHTWPREWSVT
jgi:hypothetical protein